MNPLSGTTATPTPAGVRAAYGWRSHYTLIILLAVYTMSFIDRQIMGILMEPIKREFQVSDTAMGLLSGLTFALFYSTLAIPFGRYADRANRRNFVAYCCAAWSAMTALCGMAGGYWSLALARVGVAVGEAGGTSPSMSMIADHYPPQLRGRAMGVYWIGPQLGILFGLTLGGWIAHHYGWRAAFLWMGLPGIAVALLLRYTGVEPQRGRWEATAAAGSAQEPLRLLLRDLWASKTFVRITLAGLMMGFAGYGIGIWTPAFLVRSHGMTLQGAGAIMGLLGGAMAALGALLAGWLCDTLSRRDARWRVGVCQRWAVCCPFPPDWLFTACLRARCSCWGRGQCRWALCFTCCLASRPCGGRRPSIPCWQKSWHRTAAPRRLPFSTSG